MRRFRTAAVLAIILLVAAGLRFYRLDAQSLWYDEGNSARLAERSLNLITAGAAGDIHPPLYYYALHFWHAAFGSSEFALRSLSVLFGLALVVLIFLLGRFLFDEPAGLVAAAAAAINPFQIYYSQEARMYIMLAALAALSMLALLRWLQTRTWRWGLVWALANTAGLYTHYAFPAVLATEELVFAAWWLAPFAFRSPEHESTSPFPSLLAWAGMNAMIVALYLPWLPTAIHQLRGWGAAHAAEPLDTALIETAGLFGFGLSGPPGEETGLVASSILGFLALVGPMSTVAELEPDTPERLPYWLRYGSTVAWLLLPVLAVDGLGLFKGNFLKFLLVASPPFCLLLGHGLVVAWRLASGPKLMRMPEVSRSAADPAHQGAIPQPGGPTAQLYYGIILVLLTLWGVTTAQSLNRMYFDPAYARDDYRGLAQRIKTMWQMGDAVVLDAPNQWEVFTYYFPDSPAVVPVARSRPVDKSQQEAELAALAARSSRIFGVYWGDSESDPEHVVENWLDRHAYVADSTWYGGVRLVTYGLVHCGDQPVCPSDQGDGIGAVRPVDVRFGDEIRLLGYTLPTNPVRPGDILALQLIWQADRPATQRYKVFVHLMDGPARLVAQHDGEPQGNSAPTDTWKPGTAVEDKHGVIVPPDLHPGTYPLWVGLVRPDGQRLPVAVQGQPGGDEFQVATITVEPGSSVDSIPPRQ